MAKKFEFLAGSLALENLPFHWQLVEQIRRSFEDCDGYFAYKMTSLGRASDQDIPSFMVVTRQHGILVIDVVEERVQGSSEFDGTQVWQLASGKEIPSRTWSTEVYIDDLASRLKNDMSLYDRRTRNVLVPISGCVVFCANDQAEIGQWGGFIDGGDVSPVMAKDFPDWLKAIDASYSCDQETLDRICALLEGTFVYANKSPGAVHSPLQTMNDFIQASLKTIFKQDDAQRVASMQLPPGPQRIRGLAGTGKTVVLSLKAAITHNRFPDYKILYLFNTQSLYGQIQSLITRHYSVEAKRPPDFDDHLHVLHAWGGRQKPGLYSTLCQTYGISALTWNEVRGAKDALAYVYRKLLEQIGDKLQETYDLVLIDEAQDLPSEVFETVFRITKGSPHEKRIIWAYDEFQSLRDVDMKGPSELFGTDSEGLPNMPDSVLSGAYEGGIEKDFVLPNCYRTPRPVLMAAHGVALGLYAPKKSTMLYLPSDWTALGYEVIAPHRLTIEPGDEVILKRPDENSKNRLEVLLRDNGRNPMELIQTLRCQHSDEQGAVVAATIKKLIQSEGVAPEEIIIVNIVSGRDSMLALQRALTAEGIKSVLPGFFESADVFKPKGFVTISTTFRAKGNEANIVFVVNAHQVVNDYTLRMRNAFFVAVTRARGWCYISGVGQEMDKLMAELGQIQAHSPEFRFACPRPEDLPSKRLLSMSDSDLNKMQEIVELLKKNPDLAEMIKENLRGSDE
ncbi:DEAD/DEAH box helicase [Pandoraea apista]|uniref:DEAD/DEAH box helicase n=1 Tax=Pandoraea apista TaxID=93218 RepID=UPI00248E457B|nr:ATP-binding domain-containing protein [Pandoraea apista]